MKIDEVFDKQILFQLPTKIVTSICKWHESLLTSGSTCALFNKAYIWERGLKALSLQLTLTNIWNRKHKIECRKKIGNMTNFEMPISWIELSKLLYILQDELRDKKKKRNKNTGHFSSDAVSKTFAKIKCFAWCFAKRACYVCNNKESKTNKVTMCTSCGELFCQVKYITCSLYFVHGVANTALLVCDIHCNSHRFQFYRGEAPIKQSLLCCY